MCETLEEVLVDGRPSGRSLWVMLVSGQPGDNLSGCVVLFSNYPSVHFISFCCQCSSVSCQSYFVCSAVVKQYVQLTRAAFRYKVSFLKYLLTFLFPNVLHGVMSLVTCDAILILCIHICRLSLVRYNHQKYNLKSKS